MDIMQAIMDIEEKAKKIADESDELLANHEESINSEIEAKEAEANEKLERFKEQLKSETDKKISNAIRALEKDYAEKQAELDKKCSAKSAKWSEMMFKSVVGE